MSTLEDLIRDSMRLHESNAPSSSGLLATVTSRELSRRHRLQAVAASGAVAGAVPGRLLLAQASSGGQQHPVGPAAGTATATALPGGDTIVHLAAPVTADRTGTAVVEIGPAPAGADHIEIKLTCLSAGTFTVADGAGLTCSKADAAAGAGAMTYQLPVKAGQHSTTITTAGGSRWRLTATYSKVSTSAWGVNASGQTS
jgi:hypothetical protein